MMDRIMVALDGSRLAERTVPFASTLARAFDAEVVLLRVVERPGDPADGAFGSFDWRMERAEAIGYLQAVKQRLRADGVTVDLDVTAGRACEEILELAQARNIDLIVLGSHGVGGVTEFQMASTAHKVVSATRTSVLVVPAWGEVSEDAPFESVLVCVDCSSHSDWTVALAATLARFRGADLVLLHVVEKPKLLDPQGTEREREVVEELVAMNQRAAARYVAAVKERLESPELTVHTRVEVSEHIAPVLERRANAEPRPLLVLNARGHSRFEAGPHAGLVTVMLANTAHAVLVLREPARQQEDRRRWLRSADSMTRGRATLPVE